MTIGIVGEDVEPARSVVQDAGESAIVRLSGPIQAADVHVAMGEAALLSLVRDGVETPVLAVGVDAGVLSVPSAAMPAAIETVLEDEETIVPVQTLSVTVGASEYRALMDVMVVSTEAARISEYEIRVRADDRPFTPVTIDSVRADGVVVSTPVGTPGYGTAAGGPIMDPGLFGLAIVPVGPFRVEQPHWVLAPPLAIEVVREEVPVSLLVDDREVGTIPRGTPVELTAGPELGFVSTPDSRVSFDRRQDEPAERV